MTFLLPFVAFALAIAAPFILRTERRNPDLWRTLALLALLLGAGVLIVRSAPEIDRTPALVGMALGAAGCLLGSWSGGPGFGLAAAASLHLLPTTSLPAGGMALVAGAGLGALTVGGEASAIAAVLVVATDNLGMRHSQVPAAAFIGSQAGIGLSVAALFPKFRESSISFLRPIFVGAVAMLAGPFLYREEDFTGIAFWLALGAVAGVVIHFLMPEGEGESPRVGLAGVIGLGLSTVGFSLGRGLGMAVSVLAAVGILLALDNRRAVLTLGPAIGLVLFRVLREAGTGATRALDIAQHYTLLALILGLTLPLLPTDWLASRIKARAPGALLWGIVAIAAPPLVVVALGMRGGIGFVVGLGISGLVHALRSRDTSLLPLALGAGMGGGTVLVLSWLGDESTQTRDEKIRLFGYVAVGVVILAALLAAAGRTKQAAEVNS